MARKKAAETKEEEIVLTDKDFYKIDKLVATGATYLMCMGQRGNGKTYDILKKLLIDYKKNGRKTMYVRRWKEDIATRHATKLFDNLIADGTVEKIFGKGYTIKYFRGEYKLYDKDDAYVDTIFYNSDLSTAHHGKSVAYPEVKNIFFDEFIQMIGERTLPGEFNMFDNLVSTVARVKPDFKIYMAANSVSKYSTYFTHFGIDVNHMKQGEIVERTFSTGYSLIKVAFEWCAFNEKIARLTSKYSMSKMILTGEWEIPPIDDIPTVTGEIANEKMLFTIFDPESDMTIGCFLRRTKWIDLVKNDCVYYNREHNREFLVIRQTPERISSYYHLTTQKGLSYNLWHNIQDMLKDINENCGIDVMKELRMGRVFCDSMFTADYFNHAFMWYSTTKIRDLL